MNGSIKVLDCTLRDGGYYNNWNFEPRLVNSYLQTMERAGIDYVEIGFRNPSVSRFVGPFYYTTDRFLERLDFPFDSMNVGVMIDAKAYLGEGCPSISDFFSKENQSPVKFVRIACHFEQVAQSRVLADELKKLGYQVGFNLMQISSRTPEEIQSAVSTVDSWGAVDVLYFADSFGNLDSEHVEKILDSIQSKWAGELGVHAHDNMGKAVANTFAAVERGVNWVDCTVLGMGRGAGNTRTETLLIELKKRGFSQYVPEACFSLVLDHFEKLQAEYSWGPNLLYYLAGFHGVHPSYVQSMLARNFYSKMEMAGFIEKMSGTSYAQNYVDNAWDQLTSYGEGESDSSRDVSGMLAGRDVLLVGPGPQARQHVEAINAFISAKNPFVLSLNTSAKNIGIDKIDAFIACNHTRVLIDFDYYVSNKAPLITPMGWVPPHLSEKMQQATVIDYSMQVSGAEFSWNNTGCVIPKNWVLPYALCFLNSAGIANIYSVGLDGYGSDLKQHDEVDRLLAKYEEQPTSAPLASLTPTSYMGLRPSSVYDPRYFTET